MLFCITHNRDQPPLKSTLFQLQVFANIRSLKMSKWEMCIQLFLDLILDKDKYKMSLQSELLGQFHLIGDCASDVSGGRICLTQNAEI